MIVTGWHGGWGNFSIPDEHFIGTGEGDSQGWGLYVAEKRKGGEYFAEYMHFLGKPGFVHKVQFELEDNELWVDVSTKGFSANNGKYFTYSDYYELRSRQGDREAARYLQTIGVKAFGTTYVIIDLSTVLVVEPYQLDVRKGRMLWERIR